VLRSGETSFEYERTIQPRPKLVRGTGELEELLEANAAKPAREQLTLIRIFEEFRGHIALAPCRSAMWPTPRNMRSLSV
jgi:hypothetical protein